MAYLTINTNTKEGKELLESIRKHRAVKLLHTPNEETKQALRDAKAGKGEMIKDVKKWFKKVLG